MPTYAEYLAHARTKGFQPVSQATFDSLIRAGFNPITGAFK
jgi:hypothetical protein